jgi:hypothetical protein
MITTSDGWKLHEWSNATLVLVRKCTLREGKVNSIGIMSNGVYLFSTGTPECRRDAALYVRPSDITIDIITTVCEGNWKLAAEVICAWRLNRRELFNVVRRKEARDGSLAGVSVG